MDENRNTKEPSCCQPRFNEHSAPNRDDPVSAEDVPVQNGNGHIGLDTSRTLVTEVISEKTELMSDTYMNGDSSHQVKFEDSEEPVVEIEVEKIRPLHYSVSETPPPHLLALFGLQVCKDFLSYFPYLSPPPLSLTLSYFLSFVLPLSLSYSLFFSLTLSLSLSSLISSHTS